MSNMLEQAIVDAAALKEAALKNAEAAILEKYAPEIKNAVDQLLTEAPEDEELGLEPEEGMEEDPMAGGEGEEEEPMDDLGATPSYGEGEKLCPCPDEEEKIEFDRHDTAELLSQFLHGEQGALLVASLHLSCLDHFFSSMALHLRQLNRPRTSLPHEVSE